MRIFLFISILFLLSCKGMSGFGQTTLNQAADPPYSHISDPWIDSLLQTMTLEEKIGQLFMISAYSNKDETDYRQIDSFIQKYKIGGLIFMQGTPDKQVELLNRYQAESDIPLMIGFDGEWGLSMRLKNTTAFPRQLMLGAIQNDSLIYEMGKEFGRQMKRMGININFAPDIDVNNNPFNPVINDRSFGENKYNVARKGIMYMKGLQDAGVLACGKHFPGHGDTDVDSHKDLPVIKASRERLDTLELYPFKQLVQNGLGSVMVAHLNVPALDSTPNRPTTLSSQVIDTLLGKELGFKGLIFTDAMNMKGVTKYFTAGNAELAALEAGNDIILFPDNVDSAVIKIREAVDSGEISMDYINDRVKKILQTKAWLGLKTFKPISSYNLGSDINTSQADYLKEKLIGEAITVVRDKDGVLPILNIGYQDIMSVTIGRTSSTPFTESINKYTGIKDFYIAKDAKAQDFLTLLKNVKGADIVIANVQDMSSYASKNFGLTDLAIEFLGKLKEQNKTLLVLFGNPYSLIKFPNYNNVIVAYNEDTVTQKMAGQIIFGGREAKGKLPVSAGAYKYGDGMYTGPITRLRYGNPLEVGIDPRNLKGIDSIVQNAIDIRAMPGCQVLVAKDGVIFYEKPFGKQTYELNSRNIDAFDMYDLASVTKVTATLPLLMKLVEDSVINLDKTIGSYITIPESSKVRNLIIRDILTHQSGLPAWIPFYKDVMVNGHPDPYLFYPIKEDVFSVRVSEGLYMCSSEIDSMYNRIYNCDIGPKEYKYSDLGYYLFKKLIEQKYKMGLEENDQRFFYKTLGMNNTLFRPREKGYSLTHIPPTVEDDYFRFTTVQGDVHDPGAAMLGGVGGHAGLFSDANDLAKYLQMLLNGGTYGGIRYFKPETIKEFTRKQSSKSRRGIGWDKPELNSDNGPTCRSASPETFGHTGFTGTCMWADPKYNLIYIFLSNRTYPSEDNKLLINKDIRPKIQQVIYDAISKSKQP